jgi:hypothetical protein
VTQAGGRFAILPGMCLALSVLVLQVALFAPRAAAKDVVMYLCGRDLCRGRADGRQKQRLTQGDACSRPSISAAGGSSRSARARASTPPGSASNG